MILLLIVVFWFFSGTAIYLTVCYHHEGTVTILDIMVSLLAGIVGPIIISLLFLGYFLHATGYLDTVIIEKKHPK